jgi:cystathionine beta-lyase family protein involved in aluminum resistance
VKTFGKINNNRRYTSYGSRSSLYIGEVHDMIQWIKCLFGFHEYILDYCHFDDVENGNVWSGRADVCKYCGTIGGIHGTSKD